jgi:hypothetical protein
MIPSEPITNGQGTEPVQTLGQCFLRAEGLHSRRMVLWWETAGTPHEMPAWRFYRQVIRLALFMRERLGLIANDRVLVASPLRAERVIAEWATVILGGLAIGLDGEAAEGVSFSGAETPTKVAFVAGAPEAARWLRAMRGHTGSTIALDPGALPPQAHSWNEALDLGGTLDTAERAEALRSRARVLPPAAPALGYVDPEGGKTELLTHADMVGRLRQFWARVPARDGDVAYVFRDGHSTPWCLPLWAFVADGRTCTALGTPGRESEELEALRPQLIVGSPELGRGAGPTSSAKAPKGRVLEGPIPILQRLWDRFAPGRGETTRDSVRAILTFDGQRIEDG